MSITEMTRSVQLMWRTSDVSLVAEEPAAVCSSDFTNQGSARHIVASRVLHPIELLSPMLQPPVEKVEWGCYTVCGCSVRFFFLKIH